MKTLLKRFKHFAGLGFVGVLLFSGFLTVAPQSPAVDTAYAGTCTDTNTDPNCFSNPPPARPACTDTSTDPNCLNNPSPSASGSPCAGVNAPAGYNCDTIQTGCPGSGSRYQQADPNANLVCTFDPTPTSTWTCPSASCKLPSGTVTKGQQSATQTADPNANDPELDCNTHETVLDWVICPVVKITNAAINGLDTIIINLLEVDAPNVDESKPTGARYYQAWQSFRNIALGILVVGALFMIIGQALGFEMLDAYTVKKVLPRLIVAIIGISLSWEIMAWFVTFTNDLGYGVRSLIYYPFRGIDGGAITGGGEGILVYLLTAPGILAAGGIYGLLLLAGSAFLSLLVAFLVLTLRQLVIIVLLLFAPIAIACYILPNTQGVWKLWYESFTKALFMFPIIMAFLAVGRVFAQVSSGPSATTVGQFIAFIAYILPYFLIPLTFRFAGGAVRTLGGFVNDRSRGGFDRLKKARQENSASRMEKMKEGRLYRPNTKLGRAFNATTNTIAGAKEGGLSPGKFRSRYTAAQAEQQYNQAEELRTKNSEFATGAQDDRILRAVQYGKGREGIRKHLRENEKVTDETELDTMVGIAERMQSSGNIQAVRTAAAIQRFATGTGYNDENGEFDAEAAIQSIKDVSGGDRALGGRLLGTAKVTAAQANQLSFGGASYGALSKQLTNAYENRTVDADEIYLDAWEGNDAVSVARARVPHVKAMTGAVARRMAKLEAEGPQARPGKAEIDPGELGRLAAQVQNFKQSATMYSAPDRQVTINVESGAPQVVEQKLRVQLNEHRENVSAARKAGLQEPELPPNLREYVAHLSGRAADPNDERLPKRDQ